MRPCFFALSESAALGTEVCRAAGLEPTPLEERRFESGEFKLRPLESVRGRTAFVFQSLANTPDAPVADRFVRLLFLLQGLRDVGALRLVAVIPYLAYARKDRRTQLRDPVNTRYVAQLIEAAGCDQLVTLDVHNPAALDNAFRIPVDHLSALPMLAHHFASLYGREQLVVVSPDVGGVKRAQVFRELLAEHLGREVPLAFVEKRRAEGVVSGGTLVGMPAGKSVVVMLDDLCATGGTLIRAAEVCRDAGATAVHVAVTHAPLAEGIAALRAADAISTVVTTDSVGMRHAPDDGKLVTLSIAPLLGLAIRRMLDGRPLAPLHRRWPVSDAD